MLHLRLLQCAVALAKHRHFRKAAEEMRITQSGFTQSIQRLEEHYDQPLFVRDRQGVSLTQYGEIVVDGARAILERAAAIEREIKLAGNLETGQLVVGADPLLANSVLGPALSNLLDKHPLLRINVRSELPEELGSLMERRELDLFVSYPMLKTNPGVELRTYSIPSPVVVSAPQHPATKKAMLTFADVLEYPILGGTLPQWYFDWIDSQIGLDRSQLDHSTLVSLQFDDLGLLKRITKSSAAIMALMRSDVQAEIDLGQLAELQVQNWPKTVPIAIGVPSDRPLPAAAQRLLEEINRIVTEL